jgi:hypothetical protein
MPGGESVGFLHDDAPYLKIGQGPPLVMVPGLTPEHDVPRGWQRRMALASARPLARDFTVYVVNRKRGLQPGESMSDIAGHLVNAIERGPCARPALRPCPVPREGGSCRCRLGRPGRDSRER